MYYNYNRVYSKDFVENNMDSKGFKYQPLPFTIELPPVYKNDGFIDLLGFMVKPDQVGIINVQ